jgi:hypothetical protein
MRYLLLEVSIIISMDAIFIVIGVNEHIFTMSLIEGSITNLTINYTTINILEST